MNADEVFFYLTSSHQCRELATLHHSTPPPLRSNPAKAQLLLRLLEATARKINSLLCRMQFPVASSDPVLDSVVSCYRQGCLNPQMCNLSNLCLQVFIKPNKYFYNWTKSLSCPQSVPNAGLKMGKEVAWYLKDWANSFDRGTQSDWAGLSIPTHRLQLHRIGCCWYQFPPAPRGLTDQPLAEAEASYGEQHKSFSLQEIKKQGNKHQHLRKPQTGSDGKLPWDCLCSRSMDQLQCGAINT